MNTRKRYFAGTRIRKKYWDKEEKRFILDFRLKPESVKSFTLDDWKKELNAREIRSSTN